MDTTAPLTVRYELTTRDARDLMLGITGRIWVLLAVAVPLLLWLIIPAVTEGWPAWLRLAAAVACLPVLAWLLLGQVPRQVVNTVRGPLTWSVDRAGFRVATRGTSAAVDWDAITAVVLRPRLVQFRLSRAAGHATTLPRRVLTPAQLAVLTDLAAAHGVPVRTGRTLG